MGEGAGRAERTLLRPKEWHHFAGRRIDRSDLITGRDHLLPGGRRDAADLAQDHIT